MGYSLRLLDAESGVVLWSGHVDVDYRSLAVLCGLFPALSAPAAYGPQRLRADIAKALRDLERRRERLVPVFGEPHLAAFVEILTRWRDACVAYPHGVSSP